jgi:aarF domain-containing kinase
VRWSERQELDAAGYEEAMRSVHKRAADRILKTCLRNGGLYIKFGQGVVSMNHILPPEYLDTLKVLQDKCLTRKDDEELDTIFRQDFDGATPEDLFAEFDREPIAAASLAQVFRAKTKSGGEEVAVKVQYIDLRERYKSDVPTMSSILNIIEIMHPSFAFGWIFKDLRGRLVKELDFLEEGRNSERCASDLTCFPFVHVPLVHWVSCSHRVLTTEFIDGIRIGDVSALKGAGFDMADVDRKMVSAFAQQVRRG